MTDVTCCEKCCKPLDDHPLIDVSNVKVLQMCDRHPKWVRVEPGTVIPADQPYRVERGERNRERATEYVRDEEVIVTDLWRSHTYFVDSSWKPPLVLPTEPTWGIAVCKDSVADTGRWFLSGTILNRSHRDLVTHYDTIAADHIADFIPLTDEQVARIEAAR